jgi:hypothetical protein
MIEAALAGKLSCLASEDALTSAVFGRLRYLPAGVIGRWLDTALPSANERIRERPWSQEEVPELDFWPTWPDADGTSVEPDVLLRYGDSLVVVEAKLWSGKSGTKQDQLARQWRVGVMHFAQTTRSFRLAAHVYLTAHLTRPDKELAESMNALKNAGYNHTHLWWLSWATLSPILAEMAQNPIASDLLEYLRAVGVVRFVGWNIKPGRPVTWHYTRAVDAPYWERARLSPQRWRYRKQEQGYWTGVTAAAPAAWAYERTANERHQ